tara:strand:- start:5027 stop:5242 length:216 start_codon:yes stop_codon:yes gene_type:complete
MDNTTTQTSTTGIYTTEGIAMVIAGISAAIVSIVYSLKSVKHSDCGWFSCDQKVKDDCPEPEVKERVLTFV